MKGKRRGKEEKRGGKGDKEKKSIRGRIITKSAT